MRVPNIRVLHLLSEHLELKYLLRFAESVVQVKRVRITCFAELKIGEILDSPLGTVLAAYNDVELAGHWAE